MTTIAVPRRCSDNLAQRWSRADTRSDVSPHHQSEPTTATFNDNLEQQTQLLLSPVRLINRLKGLCAPALPPTTSAKSP